MSNLIFFGTGNSFQANLQLVTVFLLKYDISLTYRTHVATTD